MEEVNRMNISIPMIRMAHLSALATVSSVILTSAVVWLVLISTSSHDWAKFLVPNGTSGNDECETQLTCQRISDINLTSLEYTKLICSKSEETVAVAVAEKFNELLYYLDSEKYKLPLLLNLMIWANFLSIGIFIGHYEQLWYHQLRRQRRDQLQDQYDRA